MIRFSNIERPNPASADPANDPAADRPEAGACFGGETAAQRTERHIQALARFIEIGVTVGTALQQQALAQAAEAPAAGRAAGELSLALYRLSRMVRLNVVLEERLIEDFEARDRKAEADRARQAQLAEAAQLQREKALVERTVREAAETDDRLEQADVEALLTDLHERFDEGEFDHIFADRTLEEIAAGVLLGHDIVPDWERLSAVQAARAAREAAAAAPPDARAPDCAAADGGAVPPASPEPAAPAAAPEPPPAKTGTDPP